MEMRHKKLLQWNKEHPRPYGVELTIDTVLAVMPRNYYRRPSRNAERALARFDIRKLGLNA